MCFQGSLVAWDQACICDCSAYSGTFANLLLFYPLYFDGCLIGNVYIFSFLYFSPFFCHSRFYVAYPDAYQKPSERDTARWNDGRGTLESSLQGIDDVKFIVNMGAEIAVKVPLDKSRIFVTGASNGGMMTCRLGCDAGGVFAGIAPVR